MSKIIGIDLGTTNSCVAVMEGGEAVVIANAEGNRTTPSVVAFSKTGERMVGQVAKRQAVTNHDRTIASIKREMGTSFKVAIDDKQYTPQEISAMVLQKLKADAEAYLGGTVTEAVAGVLIFIPRIFKMIVHILPPFSYFNCIISYYIITTLRHFASRFFSTNPRSDRPGGKILCSYIRKRGF